MYKLFIGILIIGLCLGYITNDLLTNPTLILEQPTPGLPEQPSPQQRITLEDITQTTNDLTIHKPATLLVHYTNTNSMDPTLDENSIGIELPYTNQQLHEGDIISYDYEGQRLVHRIQTINGNTLTLQGDNSNTSHTITDKNIKGILIGILY
ncbi:MAG TPA: S26 family signal peptidase [Candidatus Nanoarchaeia archaeon]|nr:S26 family signal peptidase [Candidatus Nanoarchaeia archaeon]